MDDTVLRNRAKTKGATVTTSPKNVTKKRRSTSSSADDSKIIKRAEQPPLTPVNLDGEPVHADSKSPQIATDAALANQINVNQKERFCWASYLIPVIPQQISVSLDLNTFILFVISFYTRIYRLSSPNNVVFDELHYGKYVSLYMRNTFFFDQHPPLGKQLIAGVAHLIGYNGNFTFSKIGSEYTENVPIVWLRFVPALCGSFLAPIAYKLMLELKISRRNSALAGLLIIFDNALLTQSRFVLMESLLLLFTLLGTLFLLRFHKHTSFGLAWLVNLILSATFFTCTLATKYVGFFSYSLAAITIFRNLWHLLSDKTLSDWHVIVQVISRWTIFLVVSIGVYVSIFYVHLSVLHKAGPHDSVMTSAFQASLDGGLASITKGQPLSVVHGSQITLRHTLGRTCWMHSHPHVYPLRYPDKRGSSHQQQVTCYSFKDVNNWWIVKRPERKDLLVGDELDPIRDGEVVQLVHGITSRALNSHDVAAAMSPQSQEVTCYIDYNVSMSAEIEWRVEIINKDQAGPMWHAITSQIRLVHVNTGQALKFSGRQLPEWGFNQHEIVADKVHVHADTVWNVEEHRYTKTDDKKERERQLLNAEMIPTAPTTLSFWDKFFELQSKMLWHVDTLQSHMYSSTPMEWPLMSKGIAYWVDRSSNGQIHLLGNIVIWYSGTLAICMYCAFLIYYLLRRQRLCVDLDPIKWDQFKIIGELFLTGYLLNFVPYFFMDRTLFLHNYFPALIFKILLLAYIIEHIQSIVRHRLLRWTINVLLLIWLAAIVTVFYKFAALSYGTVKLSAEDVVRLRWKDTWDFILHKNIN